MRFGWNSCTMAQKALGSCDLAGTHIYHGSKNSPKKRRRRERGPKSEFFIRDRERSNNYVRKHSEFSCVCFLRCAASEFRTFGFQRLVSDFRGLFRISEGCFGVLEIKKSKLNPFPIVFPKTTHISRTKKQQNRCICMSYVESSSVNSHHEHIQQTRPQSQSLFNPRKPQLPWP